MLLLAAFAVVALLLLHDFTAEAVALFAVVVAGFAAKKIECFSADVSATFAVVFAM